MNILQACKIGDFEYVKHYAEKGRDIDAMKDI